MQETNLDNQAENETVLVDIDDKQIDDNSAKTVEVESKENTDTTVQESKEETQQSNEHEQYNKGVQKRIDELTAKRKTAIEEAQAAYIYAQEKQKENEQLKQQLQQSDKVYVEEYDNRVESQTRQAKDILKKALEDNDTDKVVEAQDIIAKLAIEKERARIQKQRQEQQLKIQQQNTQESIPRTKKDLDPKLQTWISENDSWFQKDREMTGYARGLHEKLVLEDNLNPMSDEYYEAINQGMRKQFPDFFGVKRNNAQSVAPASNGRSIKSGRKKTVELNPGQVAFAKKMKIPLERYAAEVAKIQSRSASNG